MAKRKNKAKRNDRRTWTPIDRHQRQGNQLVPPWIRLAETLEFTHWTHDRLPEMIWAGLIRTSLGQENTLHYFRQIISFIQTHERKPELYDLSLSGIAKLDAPLREDLIDFITAPPEVGPALSTMLWFKDLPARNDWSSRLPNGQPDVNLLTVAVADMLYHQSPAATDCRWLRLMGLLTGNKLSVATKVRHLAEEWINYPADYDRVQATVRAAEGGITNLTEEFPDHTWPESFWADAWENTECVLFEPTTAEDARQTTLTRGRIGAVLESLEHHWAETHSTTRIDAKHDAVFGMAFYSLRILNETMGIGISTSVLARLALRTILETRVNLAYLLKQDDQQLWDKWRRYGAGQAKLNALKFQDLVEPPAYIDLESLEAIATEDVWQEFLTVNLGSWNNSDLRRTSDRAGIKDVYDQYYPWTSSYSHSMWGAVRESCYQTCANPLHRLHRYPKMQPLEDCLQDTALLVDQVLHQLDHAYPAFEHRLLENSHPS